MEVQGPHHFVKVMDDRAENLKLIWPNLLTDYKIKCLERLGLHVIQMCSFAATSGSSEKMMECQERIFLG